MEDYEVTGLSNQISHFVFVFLFFFLIVILQLLSVVKEEKWRKTMDDEINFIEKNDT